MEGEPIHVLVVEDDPLVRAIVVEALRDEGFQVSEASNAQEALEACLDKVADVLFTDVTLPGKITGWDIAERCRTSRPELPVIYATGYSQGSSRPVSGSIILHKPYPIESLVGTIRQLIQPKPLQASIVQRQHFPGPAD